MLTFASTNANAVYSGESASWTDNSQMVQVLARDNSGKFVFNCGGTLIDDVWVLTAAHCATTTEKLYGCATILGLEARQCYVYAEQAREVYLTTPAMPASDLRVRAAAGEERELAEVRVNPAFATVVQGEKPKWEAYDCLWRCSRVNRNQVFLYGDVALLRLRNRATGKAHSRLPSDKSLITSSRQVRALGWGDTDSGNAYHNSEMDLKSTRANTLQLTDPPTFADCDRDYAPSVSVVPSGMVLCARSPSTNGGTGQGDSGGPLYTTAADGSPTQIGVTSFGPSTGFPTAAEPEMYASVAQMVKWIRSKTGISGDVQSGSDNVGTALVIDNSGSMSSNDPAVRRRDAAKSYVSTAVDGDQVGAVGFESSASQIAPMTKMPAGRPSLLSALDSGIHAGGGTNIGAGLAQACTMLDSAVLPANRAAILLTDGDGGYSNEASCFSARGWKIFTVGLGSSVNQSLLQSIANDTGGTYQPVPDAANLQCEFQKIRATIAGATQKPCLTDLVQAGQTIVKAIAVAARIVQIVFSSSWPGSDVEMTLVSPSGRRIGRTTDAWDVTHDVGPTHETYVVKVPEPGEWKVELFGADVDPGGEPVVLGASPVPFDNALPELTASASTTVGNAPLSSTFSAQARDPDGTIASLRWDFGDDSSDSGASVAHTYQSPGTYTPTVAATDADGETTTTTLAPIVVSGQPPTAAFTASVDGGRVTVDAAGSSAPGANIARYGWDFDADGNLDHESTGPTATWPYQAVGDYTITLGVESTTGQSARAERSVSIASVSPPQDPNAGSGAPQDNAPAGGAAPASSDPLAPPADMPFGMPIAPLPDLLFSLRPTARVARDGLINVGQAVCTKTVGSCRGAVVTLSRKRASGRPAQLGRSGLSVGRRSAQTITVQLSRGTVRTLRARRSTRVILTARASASGPILVKRELTLRGR